MAGAAGISAPGQVGMVGKGSARKPQAKTIDEITIKIAENKGVTVSVREKHVDERGAGESPFIEPKTYVFPEWGEASAFIGQALGGGAPAEEAPAEPAGTMSGLTNREIKDGIAGMVQGSEQPDTFRQMRGAGPRA